jgi:HlyD family secretion protein
MRKTTFGGIATVVLAALGGTAWFHQRADGKEAPAYRMATVTRGSLKSTVSATGTLQAVKTVQVGTQVSGQISQILVDFNDHVKKGQLLARIDPVLQQQAVEDAQAQLERAQATLKQAQDDYSRNKQLFDARVITASEFSTYQSNFSVQQATVKSAQIALDRAKQNLAYTNIYSPIDGVIVQRNVDVGQTVAASLSAPQLFLIANDLHEMQILASVDESDIGQIKNGLPVNFTVQSYPNQPFTGTVQQVRLQSTTTDNVVNYTAVVSVKNDAGKLLPGMTATVTFTTASADNVLTVPNAALRIKPTDAMLAEVSAGRRASAKLGDSTQNGQNSQHRQWTGNKTGANGTRPTMIWYEDANKKLHVARVTPGLSDGQKTAITGANITEGMQVVIGVDAGQTAATASTQTSNPFQPQRSSGMGGAMGGGRGPGR